MKHLVYLGNVFNIDNSVITITPVKRQDRGHSEAITPNHSKRMQKFLWSA